jgi:hypothetical protein
MLPITVDEYTGLTGETFSPVKLFTDQSIQVNLSKKFQTIFLLPKQNTANPPGIQVQMPESATTAGQFCIWVYCHQLFTIHSYGNGTNFHCGEVNYFHCSSITNQCTLGLCNLTYLTIEILYCVGGIHQFSYQRRIFKHRT